MGLLLFSPAGTLHFPRAWLLLAMFFVPMTLLGAVLLVRSPALLEKRMQMQESEPEQRGVLLASAILLVLGVVTAGLDFRCGFTPLPWAVSIVGTLLFLFAYGLYAEVMRENAFLSRTVELQEGQRVIDTGLYAVVRHPMYTAVLLLSAAIPLVLGSGAAILPFLSMGVVLIFRIRGEERLLEAGLPGYADYKKRVKYRLIPWIW